MSVYSFGIIVMELLGEKCPTSQQSYEKLKLPTESKSLQSLSISFTPFFSVCVAYDPQSRPSASELLEILKSM